jgi:hypothetical protein
MSITDQELLGEIQEHLIEPNDGGASWPSSMWAVSEVLSYLNNRQNQFLKDTGILLSRAALLTTPNVLRQPLPTDCMFTQRVVWQSSNGVWNEIPRSDTFEADQAINSWPYNMLPRPQLYSEMEIPTLQIQVMPAPFDAGVLWTLYVALGTTLTGLGVNLTVPDEFAPAIKWGVVSDMLQKVGRALDRGRGAFAESRYQEGVEAARIILLGWETEG